MLAPLILITNRVVPRAHSVVLMTAVHPLTDDRLVAYISICRGPAIFTCQIHAVRVVVLTDNAADIRETKTYFAHLRICPRN